MYKRGPRRPTWNTPVPIVVLHTPTSSSSRALNRGRSHSDPPPYLNMDLPPDRPPPDVPAPASAADTSPAAADAKAPSTEPTNPERSTSGDDPASESQPQERPAGEPQSPHHHGEKHYSPPSYMDVYYDHISDNLRVAGGGRGARGRRNGNQPHANGTKPGHKQHQQQKANGTPGGELTPDGSGDADTSANGTLAPLLPDSTGSTTPGRNSPDTEESGALKSPAERVRFLLSNNEGDETEVVDLDLAVHALFSQMDVLCHFDDGESGWKEAARWLKYEEKVEAGDRWSKPHVATTSLHALFEVRKGIAEHTVVLDLEAPHGCLHQVAENLCTAIARDKGFSEEKRQEILEILLKPHKHKHRKGQKPKRETSFLESIAYPKAASTPEKPKKEKDTLESPTPTENGDTSTKVKKFFKTPELQRLPSTTHEISALYHTYPGGILPENLLPYKPNKRLMKKIPGGSEAANILIGQVDFLEEPVMAFARLSKCAILADLTEVAIPTRFIFLVLGPPTSSTVWEYEEVGRGMAALLSDRVFCEVAYKSTTRQDLVDGVDEFIDDLTVLPPSIWDPTTRLEPPEKTRSMDKIQKRLMDSARHAAGPEAFHFAESAVEDNSLKRTGRIFGGLVDDVKRRGPWYLSDFLDGLHMQCLASVVFLYFACITPIVTFGGLLGQQTDGQMGTIETLLAGAICGIIYALFSGQPLTIVGATGPLLVFESILYHFCHEHSLNFLPFRFWIGIWVTCILILLVAFDLSALVRYVTRFTEESFAVLISLIFIWEAWVKLFEVWDTHPIHIHAVDEDETFNRFRQCHCEHPPTVNMTTSSTNGTGLIPAYNSSINMSDYRTQDHPIFEALDWSNMVREDCITFQERIVVAAGCINESSCLSHDWMLVGKACNVYTVTHSVPDVFFLCCFLFIGTFCIAYFLRMFRNSTYFPSIVRSTLSDFAVLVAIIICTSVDYSLGLATPKLMVPNINGPANGTTPHRSWIVNPLAISHWWEPFAAILPAILATILIFLDQQITAIIVNRKEHKLKKGHGYHLDLIVLSFLIFLCAMMGLPWFVAATVRAVTHVRSLIKESELRAPGERPQFLGVREQRLTALCIHILIGLSVLLTSLLSHIPMAVLYGVFFYMGITSLSGSQFVQRILILFMPGKYQPDYIFLRHVPVKRVHLFTAIQIICMALMWVFKSVKKIALLFPMMVLALCFVRKLMDFFYSQSELYWLDHILPDEHRRKKEDGGDTDAEELDETKVSRVDEEAPTGYFPLEVTGQEPGDWDQLVYSRDYAAGRRFRPRNLSRDVIRRYRGPRGNMADEDEADNEYPIYVPFRDRKFSY